MQPLLMVCLLPPGLQQG